MTEHDRGSRRSTPAPAADRACRLPRHLLSAGDLDRDAALHVLDTAARIEQAIGGREVRKLPTLRGRTVVNLFYEDSTRTRISFEVAAKRLSADVINFSAKGSSVSKGESLKDTALDPAGHGRRRRGLPALVLRCAAAAFALGRRATWSTPATAPTSTRPRRCWTPSPCAGTSGESGRPADRDRRRRAALPGRPVQRAAAVHPRRRGHPGRAAHAASGRRRRAGRARCPTTWTLRWSAPTR